MRNEKLGAGALEAGDLDRIRKLSKADVHCHLLLGMRRDHLARISGRKITPFSYSGGGIQDINRWIRREYFPLLSIPEIFPSLIRAGFQQAVNDGVTLLEASIDVGFGHLNGIPPEQMVNLLKEAHREIAPDLIFRPSLGFSRSRSVRQLLHFFEPYPDLNYFTAIDLYDDEQGQSINNFREIYRFARSCGLRCTAHAGEFGSAEDVREAVEVLGLDAVQHGIAAAASEEVMRWLAGRGVPLNICPTSNLVLRRVSSYAAHPIRILFDQGVTVTINTDDVTLFDQGVSEEYLNLYRAGVFSADELDEIRRNSLTL